MGWVVTEERCRRRAIIEIRTQQRFWKEKVKKNGGREGFPRLAAVCWAGGQPETPGGNSSPGVVKFAMTASYHPTRCGTSLRIFLPADSRMTCAQSNETKIENRSFVTFSRTSVGSARAANGLASRNHTHANPAFLPAPHPPPLPVLLRFFPAIFPKAPAPS